MAVHNVAAAGFAEGTNELVSLPVCNVSRVRRPKHTRLAPFSACPVGPACACLTFPCPSFEMAAEWKNGRTGL